MLYDIFLSMITSAVSAARPRLTFLGGIHEPGTCILVEINGTYFLMDIGKKPGKNGGLPFHFPKGVSLDKLKAVLISHAHEDHIVGLPNLIGNGFTGRVYCTPPTKDTAELIFGGHARHIREMANYDAVSNPLSHMDTTVYKKKVSLDDNVSFTFYNASHMLGSAYVVLEYIDDGKKKKVVFSGDLGNEEKGFLSPISFPDDIGEISAVVCESSMVNVEHTPYGRFVEDFYNVINEGLERGGRIVIPTCAFQKPHELMFLISEGIKEGKIKFQKKRKKEIPPKVYFDSSQAQRFSEIVGNYSNSTYLGSHPLGVVEKVRRDHNGAFDPATALFSKIEKLTFVEDCNNSRNLKGIRDNCIIISTAEDGKGRALHHLINSFSVRDTIIFLKPPRNNTFGNAIVEASKKTNGTVKIHTEDVPLFAKVVVLNGFSDHASTDGLIRFIGRFNVGEPTVIGFHGNADSLRKHLQTCELSIPAHRIIVPTINVPIEL